MLLYHKKSTCARSLRNLQCFRRNLQFFSAANGLKLRLAYTSGQVNIWAEPVAHYGDSIDSDLIDFDATRTWRKPNHLIGLGKGDLAARVVVHWYADAKGNVSQTQSLRGVDEITQVYDYSNAETAELNNKTKEKLQDLQSEGDVRVTVRDDANVVFDVGDTVTARANLTGITVNASIVKKIVKVSGGVMSVDVLYRSRIPSMTFAALLQDETAMNMPPVILLKWSMVTRLLPM